MRSVSWNMNYGNLLRKKKWVSWKFSWTSKDSIKRFPLKIMYENCYINLIMKQEWLILVLKPFSRYISIFFHIALSKPIKRRFVTQVDIYVTPSFLKSVDNFVQTFDLVCDLHVKDITFLGNGRNQKLTRLNLLGKRRVSKRENFPYSQLHFW